MEKKKYIIPQTEVIYMNINSILIASKENYGEAIDADAPVMMNIPEEESYSEHEE